MLRTPRPGARVLSSDQIPLRRAFSPAREDSTVRKRSAVSTSDLDALFEQFLRERVYLHNITPDARLLPDRVEGVRPLASDGAAARADAPPLTRADLQHFVVHLRERGVKPVSCNCWLRLTDAFGRPATRHLWLAGKPVTRRTQSKIGQSVVEYR